MTATKDEELLSISSEAFGLLVLENHWDRWLDIYTKCGGKIKDIKKKEKLTNIQPKYTRGGLKMVILEIKELRKDKALKTFIISMNCLPL